MFQLPEGVKVAFDKIAAAFERQAAAQERIADKLDELNRRIEFEAPPTKPGKRS